ncbi:CD247 antigen like [Electrophorus electricus]|uniref:CD247 antigen like n=1 Tax=Electrophorus electricus TaxID=8005 RepID=UPI0015D040E6|nr:CD247 antigen like [Electrophorus electricus]
MAVFRTDALLFLALSVSSAEAMSWSDPITCYVLDAVLLLYCIVFTALYFRIKLSRLPPETPVINEPVYTGLNTNQISDDYQTLDQPSSQARAPGRQNQAKQSEGHYEPLRTPSNDDYQELKKKNKLHKGKRKSRESHSANRKDAAEAIEMEPLPPLPDRS